MWLNNGPRSLYRDLPRPFITNSVWNASSIPSAVVGDFPNFVRLESRKVFFTLSKFFGNGPVHFGSLCQLIGTEKMCEIY